MVDSGAARSRWRRWLALTTTMLFGTLVGIGIVEATLQLGALYIRSTEQAAPAAWHSNRRRVICVGDSNVYGLWVRRDQTWPYQLERIWNAAVPDEPIEVLNLGFPGLNSSKLRKNLRGLMTTLRPSLVLVLVGSNDMDSVPVPVEPGETPPRFYTLWQYSRVFRFLYMFVTSFRHDDVQVEVNSAKRVGVVRAGGMEFDLAGTERVDNAAKLPNWHVDLRRNLHAMEMDTAIMGATFVVLTYPSHQSLYDLANIVLMGKAVIWGGVDVATAPNPTAPRIALHAAFQRVCPSGDCPDLFLPDQHPAPAGYQLAAAIVFAELRDLGLVPGSADFRAAVNQLDPSVRDYFTRARASMH